MTGTRLLQRLAPVVHDGRVPGLVAVVAEGERVGTCTIGDAVVGRVRLRDDSIFRIQSMTKAVTAVAALQCVDAGLVRLDEPIERWMPELAHRRVLRTPTAELDDTVPAQQAITIRHLLTCTSGHGLQFQEGPYARAMAERGISNLSGTPHTLDADAWLAALAELPLVHQPGAGWRYHVSFEILALLLERLLDRPLDEVFRERIFASLGMEDTGFRVPSSSADRLVAAYEPSDAGLREVEPAGAGFYVAPPAGRWPHGELVSTAADYLAFARMLLGGGEAGGIRVLSAAATAAMTSSQVSVSVTTPDDFFPGFWEEQGWGYGVSIDRRAGREGSFGWAGGYGTTWFADPSTGRIGILMQQLALSSPGATEVMEAFESCARDGAIDEVLG